MTRNAPFIRKVVYISFMALLLIPLSFLSQPSGLDVKKHPGGLLDRIRREHDLSLSSLGDVDPTSETMKFATMGLRGVACVILWQQREDHKKKENWEAYAAVNNQISKLQPHFIKVWTFTSWDESYNVSVEFDNYLMRYHWVKKGIDRVIEGTRYNRRSPKLIADLAWVFGHKFGRSDERVQFRREFKKDDDFHQTLPIDYNDPYVRVRDWDAKIDNWLVSREFYLRSIRIAESPGASPELGQSKVIFYSNPAMASMNYADNIQTDGYFGEQSGESWRAAGREWHEYGERYIPTSAEGVNIRLNYLEQTQEQIEDLRRQLDALVEDQRQILRKERLDKLPSAERAAWLTPADERTDDQHALAATAESELHISHQEVAQRAPPDVQDAAFRLAAQLTDLEQRARFISSYRNIVNFDYWKTRAEAEQTQTMVDAKRLVHEAEDLFERAILTEYTEMVTDPATGRQVPVVRPGPKESYEEGFGNWAKILREYPVMLLDNPETEDLIEHIQRYREVLKHLDLDLAPDFSLQVIVDMYETNGQKKPNAMQIAEAWLARGRASLAPPPGVPQQEAPPESAPPDHAPPAATNDDARTAVPRPPVVPQQ